jgi:hypothetical protein
MMERKKQSAIGLNILTILFFVINGVIFNMLILYIIAGIFAVIILPPWNFKK